jgi:cysteine desulfuration protein SufE
MNKDIKTIQDEIIQEFSKLNDWFEKYEYMIKLGKSHQTIDKNLKIQKNSINGCQSQVWIKAELKEEKMIYQVDSDSLFTKGLISLLLRVLNNRKPEEIIDSDLFFIEKIGLSSNLSPSRVNGLNSILNQIRLIAEKEK